jgi:predicted transcriptional regulator of viral defense system
MACRIASDAFRSLVPLAAPHARLFKARQAKTWAAMAFKVHFGVADTWYKTSAILHESRGIGSFMPTPLQQRVVRLAARRRLIRAKDLDAIEVPRTYLARMTKAGMLEQRGRGLYALAGKDVSEQETLLEAVMLVPHGVVCLLSALRFHGLTTQNPHEVWLAIGRDQWRPTRKYPPVRIVRMSGATMTSGVEKRRIDGIEVRVFSPAKTVVDCFRYRNKVGLDVALEALREAWRSKAVSMAELTTEARKLRMERVMRPYLESLV